MKFKIPKMIPSLEDMLELEASTFGNENKYAFYCLSLSTASILSISFKPIPFNEQTLIELSIDPRSLKLSECINCCGTITRMEKSPSPLVREFNNSIKFRKPIMALLSLQITQISADHHRLLEQYYLDLILDDGQGHT
ncbi:MAG: hypothetical protein AB8G05_12110 [Oligoflexales bacterium]